MVLTHIRSQGYDRVRVYLYDEVTHELVGTVQAGGEARDDFKTLRISLNDALALVVPELQARVQKYMSEGYEDPYESTIIRKDGTVFSVEVRGRATSLEGREVGVTVVRDISEQKNLERERIHLERTSALGELAQGVAHNFM